MNPVHPVNHVHRLFRNPLTSEASQLIPPAYAGGTDCAFDFHFSFA